MARVSLVLWTKGNPDLYRHMASLCHSELIYYMYMTNCGLKNQDIGGMVKLSFDWLANVPI